MAHAARDFVLGGGKRLRPRFAYWGWRAAGGNTDEPSLITAASSLELLHACALVHDDVMDASDTRRGKPAAHTAFAAMHREHRWSGEPNSFGAAAAILLGDLLLSWSDALFASANAGAAARAVYDLMREHVMAGQYLDVLVQARGEYSAEQALRVIEFKTSKYTVEGPLHLGAAIAGGSAATLDALSSYGRALGEAFQLRDDVLGVFGDPSVTGKPAGDDLREGKQTLLTALAMQTATPEQSGILRAGLGNPDLDGQRIEALREVMVATDALAAVETRISERTEQARAALESPAIDDSARDGLDALAAAATDRRH